MKKIIYGVVLFLFAVSINRIQVRAEQMQLLFVNEDCNMMSEPSDTSDVIAELKNEDMVIFVEDTNNGWTKIRTKEMEGFIHSEILRGLDEETKEEIRNNAFNNEMRIKDIQYQIQREREKTIFITVVIAIVVLMFGISILTGVKKMDADKEKRGKV